mmetsp:Transcript_21654/g.69730  ORF Transcript_21654/g.69730 Transcript_21654/m.69730 type:complete len:272 (-) Transcript_21654:11-826(-)
MSAGASPRYRRALVRGVASSFAEKALRQEDPSEPIDMDRLRAQHAKYVQVLKSLLPEGVIELPPDEACPDCVFVEDTAVVVGHVALLTRPGHPSRRPEVAAIREALQSIGYTVHSTEEPATLDGGDVLFTGEELFVGLSSRTNDAGVDALRAAFPSIPVTPVRVVAGLHLKSVLSMCGERQIAVASNDAGRSAFEAINKTSPGRYEAVRVPDVAPSNCLWVNGTLVHRSAGEYPASAAVLAGLGHPVVEVDASEVEKADGALTCCSILLER